MRIATYTSVLSLVSHAGCASDAWVHPDALRALPETLAGDVRVVRVPYAIGGRRFDALRIQSTTATLQLAVAHEVTVDRRGAAWLHAWTHTTQATLPGLPPNEGSSVDACGPVSVAGWWTAPPALARLRRGRTIDAVAELGTTTSVTAGDGARVPLSEVAQAHRIDATYDVASGVLAHVTIVQSGALAQTVTELALVRGP